MKRILVTVFAIIASISVASAQSNVEESQNEMRMGNMRLREGNPAEAQKHFERAYELDSSNESIRLLIARSIMQQYKPGLADQENMNKAKAAFDAYDSILGASPGNEEAFKSATYLLGQLKDEGMERQWLLQQANNPAAPAEHRAATYLLIANKLHACANAVTEANKKVVREQNKRVVKYAMPESTSDYNKARDCAIEGLNYVELASTMNPYAARIWTLKANLLREMSKLSEMNNDAAQKTFYEQQAAEAVENQNRLSGSSSGSTASTATIRGPVSGGILNGKAISKPVPPYPAKARLDGATGVVRVRVVVDEEGKVISAEAIDGHPTLRENSVMAARQARFAPTLIGGQPVKVTGILTYNFVFPKTTR